MSSQTYRMSVEIDSSGAENKVSTLKSKLTELTSTSKQLDDAFKKSSQSASLYQQAVSKIDGVSGKIKQTLDRLKTTAKGAGDGVEQAGKDIKKAGNDAKDAQSKFDGLGQAFGRLKGLMLAGMAFAGVGSVVQTADAMKTLDGQIKIATGSAEKHAVAMSEIERIAMANNVSLSSVGEMYVSNERALKQLGKSQSEVLKFTENVTQAMRLGGGSAEGQAAALTQLGQALASGVLRGDEFNSIAEQAPAIMDLLSQSLGVTTGELRKMAGEGKLTADVLYKAMTDAKATDKLQSMASQTSTTVQGALENVRTQWNLAVHTMMNSKGGLSDIIAGGILLVANGLQKVGDYLPTINQYISDVISKGKELWDSFSNSEFGQASFDVLKSAFDGLKDAIQGVIDIADGITTFLRENPEFAIALASGLTAAATAYFVITGAMSLFATVSGAVATAGGLAAMATTALGTAVAFLTSPVTIAVAAIAALVAIGVYLYRNWDTLGQKAQEVWNGIKQWASDAWQGVVNTWNGFTEWFSGLFDGFSFGGIWDSLTGGLSTAWETVKSTISTKWQEIKSSFSGGGDFLSSVWQSIKDGVSSAWESIKAAIKQKWEEIKQGFKEWLTGQPVQVQEMVDNILSIFDGLAAGIGLVWGLISTGASIAWDGIKSIVGGALDWISGTWDKIKDGASNAWESIKDTASSTWETVKSSAGTAWSAVKNNVQNNLEQAKTIVGNVATEVGNAWDKAKDGAGRAFDKVKGVIGEKLGGAKNEASQAMQGVSDAIANSGVADAFAKAFNAIKSTVASVIQAVQTLFVSGVSAWRIVLQAGLSAFATLFNTAFNTVKTVVQTAFAVIKGVVTGDMNAVKSAFQNGLSQLASIARTAITQMVGVFKSAGSQLVGVGGDIVQGLINGLKAKMAQAIAVARDMASQVVSIIKSIFRTASPSRVTRQIGEWVSEGLAIGIDYKAPVAAEKAKEMAKQVVDNIKSEKEKLSRDIFLAHQKIAGNPFAEFTADIKFGKYDGVDKKELAELQLLQAKNYAMQQAVKFVDERNQLEQQIAEIGLDELALYERKLALYDAVEEASLNELRTLNQQKIAKQNTFNLEQKIADINEKILLVGKSELEILAYQLDHAKEYQGVSNEIKQSYLERTKALQDENKELERKKKLENAKEAFDRSKHLFANRHDPQAALRYDLAKDGMKPEQIDEMVRYAQAEEQFKKLNELADKLKQGTVFGKVAMQTQITDYKTGFAFAGEYAQQSNQLETTYQQEVALLQKALEEQQITQEQHNADMLLLDEQYLAKKKTLNDTAQTSIMSGLTNIAKMYYGENKTQYKRMFQLEKAYAIARALMANKTALAGAWASAPFPANLVAVAKVALESGAIVSAISGIRPIGQAHDGIMSVPKSGTWNLEKGERVLPKHTAKAMDAKLDSLGNGGNQINITVNVDNNGNSQTTGDSHKEAKSLADNIKAVVLQTLTKERKQGGLLYGV